MLRLLTFAMLFACTLPVLADSHDWVTRSNENAQLVMDVIGRFSPEQAAALGVDGIDEEIFDEEVVEAAKAEEEGEAAETAENDTDGDAEAKT